MSKSFENLKNQLSKKLNEKNAFTDVLSLAEAKTGVNRLYIVGGLIAFNILYLIIGYGGQFLANFIGFLYPAYCSIKAIESKEKDDDTKWLTYWVVYAGFALLEFFTDIFLFWIPLYALFKCTFLLYLMAPTSWNGSVKIYYTLIRPFALKHQKTIDSGIDQATNVISDIASEVFGLKKRRRISINDNEDMDIEREINDRALTESEDENINSDGRRERKLSMEKQESQAQEDDITSKL